MKFEIIYIIEKINENTQNFDVLKIDLFHLEE